MQYSIVALLGVSSAVVTPGPLPNTAFPAHATPATLVTTAGATQEDNSGYITDVFSKVGTNIVGPYRAFRNGLYVFPTQKITKAAGSTGSKGSVGDQAGTTRTFWVTDSTFLGTYPAKTDGTTGVADGAVWTVCKDQAAINDARLCNGGPTWNTADSKSFNIPNRIVFKVGVTGQIQVGDTSTNDKFAAVTWNEDLLMASFYHSAYTTSTAVKDGTKWCSQWKNTIKSDGTDEALIGAQKGLTGRSKCSWLILTDDGKAAPSFRLVKADYSNFLLQWTEWIDPTGLGTNGRLPATQGANYWLGNYAATDGVFLNPAKSGLPTDAIWLNSDTVWAYNERNPMNKLPGSIGDIIYYPGREGIFKDVQTVTLDSGLFLGDIAAKREENQQFEQKKNDYNQKREKFDGSVDKFKKRESDFMAKSFTPEEKLPERPQAPERPTAYNGPKLNLLKAVGAGAVPFKPSLKEQGDVAYLKNGALNLPTKDFATRTGFLQSTADQTATDQQQALFTVGHVFGRLGQGV
jgi:hypothetical protein